MNKRYCRISIDTFMTILSVILMGGSFLFPDERVHQIMGILLFVMWALHVALNRKWYGAVLKGKYNAYRIMQTVINVSVLVCALLLVTSGVMMAYFVPPKMIGGALTFARMVHLVFSHWYYVFMAAHIGMHAAMIASKCFSKVNSSFVKTAIRVVCIIVSLYGVYACFVRGIHKYMFLQQEFFFFDFEKGYILFVVDYLSILVLFGTLAHWVGKLVRK